MYVCVCTYVNACACMRESFLCKGLRDPAWCSLPQGRSANPTGRRVSRNPTDPPFDYADPSHDPASRRTRHMLRVRGPPAPLAVSPCLVPPLRWGSWEGLCLAALFSLLKSSHMHPSSPSAPLPKAPLHSSPAPSPPHPVLPCTPFHQAPAAPAFNCSSNYLNHPHLWAFVRAVSSARHTLPILTLLSLLIIQVLA